jgi:hypothetical protein
MFNRIDYVMVPRDCKDEGIKLAVFLEPDGLIMSLAERVEN